jgi:hypothetical protein
MGVNPVVALGLGVAVLDEQVTTAMIAGIPLVLAGCWFAAGAGRQGSRPPTADPTTEALVTPGAWRPEERDADGAVNGADDGTDDSPDTHVAL